MDGKRSSQAAQVAEKLMAIPLLAALLWSALLPPARICPPAWRWGCEGWAWAQGQSQVSTTPAQVGQLNVLFLGVDGRQLLMACVLTISPPKGPSPSSLSPAASHAAAVGRTDFSRAHQLPLDPGQLLSLPDRSTLPHLAQRRAIAVFVPTHALISGNPGQGRVMRLADLYREFGAEAVRGAVETLLGIKTHFYVRIEQAILPEAERILGPLDVDGEKIPLSRLFTLEPSPKDDRILGALAQRLSHPGSYFVYLPHLVIVASKYVATDFLPTPTNLWLYFQVAAAVDSTSIPKILIRGHPAQVRDQNVWELDLAHLRQVRQLLGPSPPI